MYLSILFVEKCVWDLNVALIFLGDRCTKHDVIQRDFTEAGLLLHDLSTVYGERFCLCWNELLERSLIDDFFVGEGGRVRISILTLGGHLKP